MAMPGHDTSPHVSADTESVKAKINRVIAQRERAYFIPLSPLEFLAKILQAHRIDQL